jgi:hypothetical protein
MPTHLNYYLGSLKMPPTIESPADTIARLCGLAPTAPPGQSAFKAQATSVLTRAIGAEPGEHGSVDLKPEGASVSRYDHSVGRVAGPHPGDVEGRDKYTTNYGRVLPTLKTSLNIGGVPLAQDTILFEKQQAFNRMKVQERVVHACGSSAFGYFEVTDDVSHLTKAAIFQPGIKTPVSTRFSTVTYGREFPDLARNPRGFATKFYGLSGNFDLLCVNFPVFL